jgi:hypothetical protein
MSVAFGEDFAAFPARLADGRPSPRTTRRTWSAASREQQPDFPS